MARFAFAVPPFTGHINPTLSLGAALLQQGHEVGWISLDASLRERLPEGGQLLLIQYDEQDAAKRDNAAYLHLLSQKDVYGIESIRFLYDDVLIPLNRYMYEGIVAQAQQFRPDVLINDHQLFAAAIAACRLQLPYATSVTAPAAIKIMDELPKIHEWEVKQIMALQAELGLHHNRSVACSELLTLVFTSGAFFGDMPLPPWYRFVGPVIRHRPAAVPFDWARFHAAGDRPRLLVSIGTTFNHDHKKDFFSKVIDALGHEPFTVVVVSDPSLFPAWPDNFMVQEKVPQLELLPHLHGVVCHGGHNTVCETLTHGLPLVVAPIAYDQSHVAGRVVRTGCGIRLNFKRFRAAHLQAAVRDMLDNPQYREAARRIQASFESAGGTAGAAALLEQLAKPLSISI